jgi:hypothetical protein
MSADDLPPIIDLASRRHGKERAAEPVKARIVDDQLQLYVRGLWTAFGREGVNWLRQWCGKFESEQGQKRYAEEHRCRACSFVVGIECRGHRSRHPQMHYQIEVLERGACYVSRTLRDRDAGAAPERREYVRRATAACKRQVGSNVSSSWAKVTCAACLKRKPREVL